MSSVVELIREELKMRGGDTQNTPANSSGNKKPGALTPGRDERK